jgi:hypothetical protein
MLQNFLNNREERVERRQERRANRREKLRNLLDPIMEMGDREREQGTNVSTAALPTQLRSIGARSVNQSLLSNKTDKLPEPKQQTNPAGADVGADSGRRIYAQVDPDNLEKDATAGDKAKPESGEAVASPSRPRRSTTDQSPESVSQQGSKVKAQPVANQSVPAAVTKQQPVTLPVPSTHMVDQLHQEAAQLEQESRQLFDLATTAPTKDAQRMIFLRSTQAQSYAQAKRAQAQQIQDTAFATQHTNALVAEKFRREDLATQSLAEKEKAKLEMNTPAGQDKLLTEALAAGSTNPGAAVEMAMLNLRTGAGENPPPETYYAGVKPQLYTRVHGIIAGQEAAKAIGGGPALGPGHPMYPVFASRYQQIAKDQGIPAATAQLHADVGGPVRQAFSTTPMPSGQMHSNPEAAATAYINHLIGNILVPKPPMTDRLKSSTLTVPPSAWGGGTPTGTSTPAAPSPLTIPPNVWGMGTTDGTVPPEFRR